MQTQTQERHNSQYSAQGEKLPYGVDSDFMETLNTAKPEEIKQMVVNFQSSLHEAQAFLKEDTRMLGLKAAYDEAAGPTKDTIKAVRNKTKACIKELQLRGKV